jgi:dipeptidase
MVALGNSTADSRVLFAKNSDRQPNERLVTIRVPRRHYPTGAKVKCTYIEIDQAEETHEVVLLKPHWMWGAEMGGNEYGLVIGNEAVFTKEPKGRDSLLGMDMLRLALERCRTSREAVDLLIDLLEVYGQGGNCGFEKKFTYHNAFLIADRTSAWVLETAGQYWAALEVRDVYSISNRLSIGSQFDLAHPRLISHAVEKGWCRSEADFDFARCYSEPVFTHFSGSKIRRQCSFDRLRRMKGRITVETMMEILRSHTPAYDKNPYRRSSISSVCMHAGFLFGDQTTGSYVVKLGHAVDTYWITGGSPACLGLFKPFFLAKGEAFSHGPDELEEAKSAWERREEIHRLALENRIKADDYKKDRDLLETKWVQGVNRLDLSSATEQELAEFVNTALKEEDKLLDYYLDQSEDKKPRVKGNPYFRHYWKKAIRDLRPEKR